MTFAASMETLNSPGFQEISYVQSVLSSKMQKYSTMLFDRRFGSVLPFNSSVLSASELAAIFHFPNGIVRTESLVHSHSRVFTRANQFARKSKVGCCNWR
jgi:hypothetical protein